jgi:molybdopterin synthase catalytic subunit
MFSISNTTINSEELRKKMFNASAGAFVCFEGWVRNHNEGKEVLLLEYEAYEKLAINEAKKIFEEAKSKFDIYDIICVHRVGSLEIGDIAVWVGVNSAHRGASFDACEYIIDNIKVRLPIWKKEHYIDGNSGWVNCEQCSKAGEFHKHSH